jgi:hypothetical protein
MQQDGLVDRLRSDADRRKRVLLLSPSGHRLLERVEIAKQSWATRLLQPVPADDRSTLQLLMRQLVANLDGDTASKRPSIGTNRSEATSSESDQAWENRPLPEVEVLNSPHFALRQMLSALGLNDQLAEDGA